MFTMAIQNSPRLSMIEVVSGDITYLAEAQPEAVHTQAVWVLSRVEQVDANTRVIKVKRGVFAPGVNGADLATIWGD